MGCKGGGADRVSGREALLSVTNSVLVLPPARPPPPPLPNGRLLPPAAQAQWRRRSGGECDHRQLCGGRCRRRSGAHTEHPGPLCLHDPALGWSTKSERLGCVWLRNTAASVPPRMIPACIAHCGVPRLAVAVLALTLGTHLCASPHDHSVPAKRALVPLCDFPLRCVTHALARLAHLSTVLLVRTRRQALRAPIPLCFRTTT
jgi:hypothetical protein